ncbi:MAG: multicomponent Na+:H+ antiporter subunit D [Nonlabens sp.]|jgi:multicomponent Na+:H+ antiporter subunit D
MTLVAVLVVLFPLLVGSALLLVGHTRAARPAGIAASALLLVGAVALTSAAADGPVIVTVGALPAPLGITLVADVLAGVAASVSAAVLLAVQVALRGTAADRWHATRASLLVLTAGVMLAYLTADLFTLFVSFEIVLFASYALLTREGDVEGVDAAPAYVKANLIASAVFLVAIAGVYGATGHVAFAEVSAAWPEVDPAVRALTTAALLGVAATKAAIVPLGVWLPRTYGAMPPVLAAAVGAILTKVGVVALVRVLQVTGPHGTGSSTAVLVLASVTMLVGVVVAIGQKDLTRVLAAHVVSQVGFMVAGFGLLDLAGTTGGILYLGHHVLVKGALLLVAAAVMARFGTTSLGRLRGALVGHPVLAGVLLLGAATLAGLPPTTGFVAKVALLRAAIDAEVWWLLAVMGLASLLTLVSMLKVHVALRGESDGQVPPQAHWPQAQGAERRALAGAGALLTVGVVAAVLAGPLHGLAVTGATQLLGAEEVTR